MRQEQFLEVIARDEAEQRFRMGIQLSTPRVEKVSVADALGRVLAEDVVAPVDVPSFDRSNVDGFAVRAADTFGAFEDKPVRLSLNAETITTGMAPQTTIESGRASTIATGAVIPRGADAVVMVEFTEVDGQSLLVRRPAAPGAAISYAGTDIALGEIVLRALTELSSRETGVLAAIGIDRIPVLRRPRVAILSTGDEIIAPGQQMALGRVYDFNAVILADAVREVGAEPILLGIARDDEQEVRALLERGLAEAELVLLSGGTSKGAGDINYQVLETLPGARILAHGVALKPGKPICLAAVDGKPVVILPGFPTSAIFTFHEFVAPVLRELCGRQADDDPEIVKATMPLQVNSEKGRTEYLLVGLVRGDEGLAAYPMGKGSGSVTTFSRADGYITIPRNHEIIDEGAQVSVRLLGRRLRPPDLSVIGSHCAGLDALLGRLSERGITSRFLAVGSHGGLAAARRRECDLAGIHLLDPDTGVYNRPFLDQGLEVLAGYGRMQGVVFRRGDARFEDAEGARAAVAIAIKDAECILANRNRGSGTRVLVDELLGGEQPRGFAAEGRSHNSVAAAVSAQRADWGVAIETVAKQYDLGFLPLVEERFDIVCPRDRAHRPAVDAFRELATSEEGRSLLAELGFLTGVSAAPEREA